MKSVKILKDTRKMIEEYREDGESIDASIRRLLNSSEPLQKIDRDTTNINLNEETLENLKTYKAYPTQSYSDVIKELLMHHE